MQFCFQDLILGIHLGLYQKLSLSLSGCPSLTDSDVKKKLLDDLLMIIFQ